MNLDIPIFFGTSYFIMFALGIRRTTTLFVFTQIYFIVFWKKQKKKIKKNLLILMLPLLTNNLSKINSFVKILKFWYFHSIYENSYFINNLHPCFSIIFFLTHYIIFNFFYIARTISIEY